MDPARLASSSCSLAAATVYSAAAGLGQGESSPSSSPGALRRSSPVREVKERKFQNDFKSSSLAMSKKDKRISLDVRSSNPRRNPFSHGGALLDSIMREGSKATKRERTFSCDRGMEQMVKKFFEQKLIKAKKTADRDLANFIATTEEKAASDAKNGAEVLINKLKDTALAIRDSDAETLQNGKLRDGVRSAWECMWRAMNLEESSEAGTAIAVAMSGAKEPDPPSPQATQIKMLSTKLLWILSKVKHRTDYLEADYSEEFIQWAAAAFKRKDERRQTRAKMRKDPSEGVKSQLKESVEIIEDTLSGKYVVCRICEGVLREEKLSGHSKLCSEVALKQRQCENCDNNIKILVGKIEDVMQELIKAEKTASPKGSIRNGGERRRRIVTSTVSALSTFSTVQDLTQRISQIDPVAEGSVDTVGMYRTQVQRLASSMERTFRDHPSAGLLNALAASINEKCEIMKDMQSIINQIESSLNSAVGSRFGAKAKRSTSENGTTSTASAASTIRPSIRDFEIIKPISRGSFGSVLLARKKATGDIYAIKVVKKQNLIEKNQMDFIANERNILAFTDNPFVVKLYYSFQSANNLYMVMEFLPGGDCFSLLRNLTVFPEDMARFYVAELVHALGYLHSNGIIHRDLKPDNLLIGADGHLKLTDFGLSQMGLMDRQDEVYEWRNVGGMVEAENKVQETSCVGTPDYLAPEIFLSSGHGPEVDWWAVGCITYEFLVGITPFYADTCEDIFASIMSNSIIWPDGDDQLSPEAIDFISKLLTIEPSARLGAKGADEVKAHPWFAGVDWANLRNSTSPFVPKLDKSEDTFYFEARNAIYQTTWEGDPDAGNQDSQEDVVARLRNFSMVNIPHLLTLNQTLVPQPSSPTSPQPLSPSSQDVEPRTTSSSSSGLRQTSAS